MPGCLEAAGRLYGRHPQPGGDGLGRDVGAAALQFLEDVQAAPFVKSAQCKGMEAQDQPGMSHSAHQQPCTQGRGRARQVQGCTRAALLLLWHAPQEDPADNSCQLTARRAGSSVSAPCLDRGPCAVMLPGQEKEPPGLGTTVSPALRVLAQAQTPQASDQAKRVVMSVPSTENFRLSAYFEPLHQKP